MSFAAERASIEERLFDNWLTTPIAFDNVDFDPPNNSEWVRLNILNGASSNRTIEAKKRHTGAIVLQLFAPKHGGTGTLRGYADTLAEIFEDQTFDDVVCDTASLTNVAGSDEWYQLNLTIPYWRDET